MVLQGTIYEEVTGGVAPISEKQMLLSACDSDPDPDDCRRDINLQYREPAPRMPTIQVSSPRVTDFDTAYIPPLLNSLIRNRERLLTERLLQSELEDRVRRSLEEKNRETTKELIEKEVQARIKELKSTVRKSASKPKSRSRSRSQRKKSKNKTKTKPKKKTRS